MSLTTIQKISRLGSDSDIWHDIVHGSDADSVSTEGGAVMTAAAAVKSLKTFVMRGLWASGTPYEFKNLYVDSGVVYMVLRDHVATTVADDLMAGYVAVYQDGAFMQDGAGAVLRTPQAKMREVVTPFDFEGSSSDYSAAIANAAAAHTAIKIPPGDYSILSSLDLTGASFVFDRGARLLPAAGVTIQLGSISAGLYQIFGGLGSCTVSGLTERVYPEWWGAVGDGGVTPDHVALKAAVDNSATFRNIATLTRKYGLGARLEINPTAQIDSSRASSFVPTGGQPDGVVLLRGNMTGPQVLPSFVGFIGCALEVRCALGDIRVRQFNNCGTPIRFQAGGTGESASVLNTIVRFDSIYQASNIAVEFAFNYAADVIQACGVIGNFITESKTAVAFTGVAAFDDGLFCEIFALDFTQGGGAVLDNRIAGHSVPRFTLSVESWVGGTGFVEAGNETKIVKGSWNNAEINFVNAQQFSQANLAYQLLRAARIKCRQWGSLGGAVPLVRLTDGLPVFNGGKASDKTNFIAKITLASDLSPGTATAYYFYSIWSDGAYAGWKVGVITAPGNVSLMWAQDQGDTEAYRVGISIRNHGTTAIPAGSIINFYIERA
ncbi:hypothetical protein [Burkholderia anthina]|uniref:hypothetical protein n=1 Tax=Burkholderia anthina TaxID=179879 RepID=UPI001AA04C86|nr:hypothetical protein [Burkholderia anthina]QTD91752.1 hypothetical protein J4G50_26210 [Burkholderia anthina]